MTLGVQWRSRMLLIGSVYWKVLLGTLEQGRSATFLLKKTPLELRLYYIQPFSSVEHVWTLHFYDRLYGSWFGISMA